MDNVSRKKRQLSKPNKQKKLLPELQIILSKNESEKILNNEPDKNVFISCCNFLQDFLLQSDIQIDDDLYHKLLDIRDLIDRNLMVYKSQNRPLESVSVPENLSVSSKNFSLSSLSLCSGTSISSDRIPENDSSYKQFLITVNCPFCFQPQADKSVLIKHLNESCMPLINNTFEERSFIPYSVFKILPNNAFVCNVCHNSKVLKSIKSYFVHNQTETHVLNVAKAKKSKKHSEFLFCCCCKVLVPNNYTQIEFHLKHAVHASKRKENSVLEIHKKKVHCVYLKNKKFKCLDCSSKNQYQNVKDILEHFEDSRHGNDRNSLKVFCEVCKEEIHVFKVISHLNSKDHIDKENQSPLTDWFELCCFCNFTCSDLKELSQHMKTQCRNIKLQDKSLNVENVKKNVSTEKDAENKKMVKEPVKKNKSEKRITELDNTKEGMHIIVKDRTDIVNVYKCFKSFGVIAGVEIYKDKNIRLQFQDKRVVTDIQLLQNTIRINGKAVEITTDETIIEPIKEQEKPMEEAKSVNIFHKSEDDSSDELEPEVPNYKLAALFQKVIVHLSNATSRLNVSLIKESLKEFLNYENLLNNGNCFVVGFAGCELSFTVESISVHCKPMSIEKADDYSLMLVKFCRLLTATSEWEVLNVDHKKCIPCVESKLKAIQKSFTFFVHLPFVEELTIILRYCIAENICVKRFCLILRFWFSVHDLKIREYEFAIISLIIFFLIRENIVQNINKKFSLTYNELSMFRDLIGPSWQNCTPMKERTHCKNVLKMFRKFLKFLVKFDFYNNAIYLPVGCDVPKTALQKHQYFSTSVESINFDSPMWVFVPGFSRNLTLALSKDDLTSLQEAAQMTLKNTR